MPERIEEQIDTRRMETGGERIHCLQPVKLMRTSLIALAQVIGPLRTLEGEMLVGTNLTKRVAANRMTQDQDWMAGRPELWNKDKEMKQDAVKLAYLQAVLRVLIFQTGDVLSRRSRCSISTAAGPARACAMSLWRCAADTLRVHSFALRSTGRAMLLLTVAGGVSGCCMAG